MTTNYETRQNNIGLYQRIIKGVRGVIGINSRKQNSINEDPYYKSFLRMASGASKKDLENSLDFYRKERSVFTTIQIAFGFKDEQVYIKAFEKALEEKIEKS